MHIAKLKDNKLKDDIFRNNFVCPKCRCHFIEDGNKLICKSCGQAYPSVKGIVDFREKDSYWCNVSREKMEQLNSLARTSGDWLQAAEKIVPQYANHFKPFYRADSQFLWPTTKDSRILDAGSMWGGITIPTAKIHREVYAVDKTIETLEFLKIRAKQMGIKNIYPFAASLKTLPFPNDFFDHIILNGVLEWVALEEDVILEKHWKGKRTEKQVYSKTPREMQIDVLRELNRVLKSSGSLYIAIENRYGIQYFLTSPDNHNNVRFVSFLPRFLADKISRFAGKGTYRTYIYSPCQLADILNESGFKTHSMYGIYPHYSKIVKAFPLKMVRLFKREVKIYGFLPRVLLGIIRPLIPTFIARHMTPSLFAVCAKTEQEKLIPRIQNLLIKASVLNNDDDVSFVISNNRFENCNSTNITIYDRENKPLYFCKIARDITTSSLKAEADNLKWMSNKLSAAKNLNFQLPELIYYGETEGVEILVSTFLSAKNINLTSHYVINWGFDKIGLTNLTFRKSIASIEEKLFLRRIDKKIKLAIDMLVDFQQITANNRIAVKKFSKDTIDKYLGSKTNIREETRKALLSLKAQIDLMPEIDIASCSVHGDYDICNVLFSYDGKTSLVDFEHMEKVGYPFLDLATLVFNPLIKKWKNSVIKDEPFVLYLNKYAGMKYIIKWLKRFCDKSSMPYSVIPIIPLIAALEQNEKTYPPSRNPNTFPLYGEDLLEELLSIKLDHKQLISS